ncbi:hypothetical protein MBANPS3_011227 [Mucor bainieri]
MSTISSIPNEVLLMILKQDVLRLRDVARCRLVCKRWDQLAETEMFKRQINLDSDEQALAFYAHLSKKISNCKLIQHLHFNKRNGSPIKAILQPLLRLAFNPNLKRITCTASSMDTTLLEMITDIANNSKIKPDLQHLGTTEELTPPFTNAYGNALIAFKSTLRSITLKMDPINQGVVLRFADRLNEFEQLNVLHLFTGTALRDSTKDRVMKKALEGCKELKTLNINLPIPAIANLVESSTSNHPKEIILNAFSTADPRHLDTVKDDMKRMTEYIKHIPKKSVVLHYVSSPLLAASTVVTSIQEYFNSTNRIRELSSSDNDGHISLQVDLIPWTNIFGNS